MNTVLYIALALQAIMFLAGLGIMAYGMKQLRLQGTSAFEHLKARNLEEVQKLRESEVEAKVRLQSIYDYESEREQDHGQQMLTVNGKKVPASEYEFLG